MFLMLPTLTAISYFAINSLKMFCSVLGSRTRKKKHKFLTIKIYVQRVSKANDSLKV